MDKVKKINKKAIIVVIAAVILLGAGAAVFASSDKSSEDTEETKTAQATLMTIQNTLESDGEVTSSLEEKVSPRTGYYLDEIKVEAGDALEEGDTILTYTNGKKMKAPYNCVVESWSLPDEEDQLTTDHYVTVAGTDVLQMELSVDEDDVKLVNAGDEVNVTIDAADTTCKGVLTSVSEIGDYSSSGTTFAAVATFDNNGSIKLGMSGSASIVLEKAENALCVPADAVSKKGDESVVTVVSSDGTESEGTVQTGIKNDAYIQITDGLSEGDTVVVPESDDDTSQGPGGGMPGGEGMPSGDPPDGGNGGPGGAPGQQQ